MQLFKGFSRWLRYYLIRLKRLQGSPQSLAGGVAIGVLIGLSPTMPFHTILIFLLAFLTRTSFMSALVVSYIVCNPITVLPLYSLSIILGNALTPYRIDAGTLNMLVSTVSKGSLSQSFALLSSMGQESVIVLLAGGFAFSLPCSVLCYVLALWFFSWREKKKRKSHASQKSNLTERCR